MSRGILQTMVSGIAPYVEPSDLEDPSVYVVLGALGIVDMIQPQIRNRSMPFEKP